MENSNLESAAKEISDVLKKYDVSLSIESQQVPVIRLKQNNQVNKEDQTEGSISIENNG